MPTLTRWYIKSALIYFVAALLLGFVLALPTSINLPEVIHTMSPAYFHLFLVGWVTQMIFGVIYWMFPIITRAQPRGNERLAWVTYIFLNVGRCCFGTKACRCTPPCGAGCRPTLSFCSSAGLSR